MGKCLREYGNDKCYSVTFDGFYDYEEFKEVMRILEEVIGFDEIKISGLDAMDGYSIKDDIRLSWKFNNWDCIEFDYDNPKSDSHIKIVKGWARMIFDLLINKFGE